MGLQEVVSALEVVGDTLRVNGEVEMLPEAPTPPLLK